MRTKGIIGFMLVFGLLTGVAPVAQAADTVAPEQTPPRLGFVEGQVSFWRPGAADWAQAQVNTPVPRQNPVRRTSG